ncbi:MAG: hypothetical protein HY078_09700 [Elusimicrobia bacterium]|nr:hypothetical protein [Elusimicrobiota bacterium]
MNRFLASAAALAAATALAAQSEGGRSTADLDAQAATAARAARAVDAQLRPLAWKNYHTGLSRERTYYDCALYPRKVVMEGAWYSPSARRSETGRFERAVTLDEAEVRRLAADALAGPIRRDGGPTDGITSIYSVPRAKAGGTFERVEFLGGPNPWIRNGSPSARKLADLLDSHCRR